MFRPFMVALAAGIFLGTLSLSPVVLARGAAAAAAAPSTAVPLIERTKFFGNPAKAEGQISPDGKWLSWIAPRDGVLNVWVAPVANPAGVKPLTAEKVRPIRTTF